MQGIFGLVGQDMPGQAPGSGKAFGDNYPGSIPNRGPIRTLCRARKGVGRYKHRSLGRATERS